MVAYVVSTLLFASGLPAHIATHFDAKGWPNGWMTNGQYVAFDLALGLGTQVFVSLACYFQRFMPARFMNVPHKDYWRSSENYPTACANIFRHSLWLGNLMVLWMILLNYQVAQANKLMPPKLDTSSFIVAMSTFAVMLLVWLVSLWRLFRVPPTPKKSRR